MSPGIGPYTSRTGPWLRWLPDEAGSPILANNSFPFSSAISCACLVYVDASELWIGVLHALWLIADRARTAVWMFSALSSLLLASCGGAGLSGEPTICATAASNLRRQPNGIPNPFKYWSLNSLRDCTVAPCRSRAEKLSRRSWCTSQLYSSTTCPGVSL